MRVIWRTLFAWQPSNPKTSAPKRVARATVPKRARSSVRACLLMLRVVSLLGPPMLLMPMPPLMIHSGNNMAPSTCCRPIVTCHMKHLGRRVRPSHATGATVARICRCLCYSTTCMEVRNRAQPTILLTITCSPSGPGPGPGSIGRQCRQLPNPTVTHAIHRATTACMALHGPRGHWQQSPSTHHTHTCTINTHCSKLYELTHNCNFYK